jgi:hypothetical protein
MTLLLIVFMLSSAIAGDQWWQTPRTEDEENYYYVGFAEGKASLPKLHERAVNYARADLIQEHFGMIIQVSESAVEELGKESFQVVSKQSSAPLYLRGTTVQRVYEKEVSGGRRVYVQLRANKKLLAEAVKNQVDRNEGESLTTYGENDDSKIDFKVKTYPQGSHIHLSRLDSTFTIQGQGDALFYLPPGHYQLAVSSPGHVTQTKMVLVQATGREEKVILRQLEFSLQLKVEPSDAKVVYEGREVSEEVLRLPVGRPVRLSISHKDYLPQEVNLIQYQPEDIQKEVSLEPRASSLSFDIRPYDAVVEVDGEVVRPYEGKIYVRPGHRFIKISHKGHYPYYQSLDIAPNRDYPLKVVRLTYDDENIPPSDRRYTFRLEYNPFMYQEDRGWFANVPLSLHWEWHYISLGFGYSFVNEIRERNEGDNIQKRDIDIRDTWMVARLISPPWQGYKFFVSAVQGNRDIKFLDYGWEQEQAIKTQKTFRGLGGGMRGYLRPRWSLHVEYLELKLQERDTNSIQKERRLQAGVAYEF